MWFNYSEFYILFDYMEELNWKILYLYYILYNISENDKNELLSLLENIDDEDKKSIIIFLYKRYEQNINNIQITLSSLKKIENKLDEWIEKVNEEEIIFNF